MASIKNKILKIFKKKPKIYDDGWPQDKKSVKRRKKNLEKWVKKIEEEKKEKE